MVVANSQVAHVDGRMKGDWLLFNSIWYPRISEKRDGKHIISGEKWRIMR